jgi:hypothetical protein
MKIKSVNIFIIFSVILLVSTEGCDRPKSSNQLGSEDTNYAATILIDYKNVVFCIPSPHQVTKFFLDNNLSFEEDLVLKATSNPVYKTNFLKALHVGIYGTNQGYQILFGRDQDSMALFLQVKELVNSLGLLEAIDEESLKAIENKQFEQDTILHFIANSYRDLNSFAESQNKQNLSVLIITGGWIESFYLLTEMQNINKNINLTYLIAEHKFALDNLIKILSPFYNTNQQFKELTDKLVDLAYDLDAVEYEYKFSQASTNKENRLTIVRSSSNIVFGREHLESLSQKIRSIRNTILTQQ